MEELKQADAALLLLVNANICKVLFLIVNECCKFLMQ